MSRQVRLPTREVGELRLLLIEEKDGQWEPEWEPLRGTVFGDQFSIVSKEVVEHALNNYSRPLVDALGIEPAGALKKVPRDSRLCIQRDRCVLHDPKLCFPESKNMPFCFEPDGVAEGSVRFAATRAFEYWRDRVYIVVIKDASAG